MASLSNNIEFPWKCPTTRMGKRSAHSTCAKSFAQESGFRLIDTSNDGNCFFYALAKFGKRANYAPLLLDPNEGRNARLLRDKLVDHMEDNMDQYTTFLAYNNNRDKTPEEQIAELRDDRAWASSAGDLVPIAGAHAFGINIDLYNIIVSEDYDQIELNPIRSRHNTDTAVSIIRVREGHFELLWPLSGNISSVVSSDPYAPTSAVPASASSYAPAPASSYAPAPASNPKYNEVIYAAQLAVQAAQVAVSTAKQIKSSRNKSHKRNKSVSRASYTTNEKKLNQMVQNLNQLSFSSQPNRTYSRDKKSPAYHTRSKKKDKSYSPSSFSSANNNNDELRRTLEESMRYQ